MFINKIILFFSNIILFTTAFDNCVNNNKIIETNVNYNMTFFGWYITSYDNLTFLKQTNDYNFDNKLCKNWFLIDNKQSFELHYNELIYNFQINELTKPTNNRSSIYFNFLTTIEKNKIKILFTRISDNKNYNNTNYIISKIYNNNTRNPSFLIYDNYNYIDMSFYYDNIQQINTIKDDFNDYFKYFSLTKADYYEIVLISYFLFLILFFSMVLINKEYKIVKILNKSVNLHLYGYTTIGTLIFYITYLIWWSTLFVYSFITNNKLEIMARLGVWITLNLSTVLLPITRNSIWVVFFNLSKDRINYVHRFLSILCLISVVVKFIAVFLFYEPKFLIKVINPTTGGSPLFGTLSTISFILICIFAMPIIRQKKFEIFYYSHRILSICIMLFGILHYMSTFYYLLPCLLLYIVDMILRIYYTNKSIYSKIKNIGSIQYNTSCTLINLTFQKKIKTYPGCYFFICFYNDISRLQWHPLSLVTTQNDNLIFCCKNVGSHSWTNRLHNKVEKNYDILINRNVYIQGPYGNISTEYNNNKYKNIILICGGIGITPMISILKDLNELYYKNKLNKLNKVIFIWSIKHISLFETFKKYFLNLDKNIFDIQIYVSINNTPYDDLQFNTDELIFKDIEKNINIIKERANIKNLLSSFFKNNNENFVFLCGPSKLTDEASSMCSKFNVDFSTEVFE